MAIRVRHQPSAVQHKALGDFADEAWQHGMPYRTWDEIDPIQKIKNSQDRNDGELALCSLELYEIVPWLSALLTKNKTRLVMQIKILGLARWSIPAAGSAKPIYW